ncbi:hypothetical protein OG689_44465 [Kitasatospora sp. NBC_00240]|uniref:hypothetical protein n=1 Tax=Kitasatospora sp. NBC_00240 TaxID=2903567 RepID=UPI0022598D6D|nr:hypothetical protein [Kitasatospora sp. NBC_00240]MCX5216193.1 hypothetical protein [Kitasatospora sp. NBC_00240]
MSAALDEDLIGHSYTRARKHPLVVGKLPGAGRIPGGPYTVTQVVTMVVAFGVLATTRAIWAHFGLMDIVIMVAVPWGLAWVLRYARLDGRDPARALRSLLVYISTPTAGRLAGQPQGALRTRIALGRCTVRPRPQAGSESAEKPRPATRQTGTAPTPPGPKQKSPAAPADRPRQAPRRPAREPAATRAEPVAAQHRPAARTALQDLLASLDER